MEGSFPSDRREKFPPDKREETTSREERAGIRNWTSSREGDTPRGGFGKTIWKIGTPIGEPKMPMGNQCDPITGMPPGFVIAQILEGLAGAWVEGDEGDDM